MTMTSTNPATSQIVERFEEHTPEQVEQKLQAAVRAFRVHRRTSFAMRAQHMQRAAEILLADKQRFDAVGHYSRPDILRLQVNPSARAGDATPSTRPSEESARP